MNKKKNGVIGIIITILLLIILVFLSNTDTQKLSYVESAVSSIVMPIQNGLTYLKNKLAGNDEFFTSVATLKEENDELKQKNSELEQSLRELEIIKSENATLKEYVNLTDKYKDYTTIPAYIINKNISNYNSLFVINVGEEDGIKENMTVIADKGLVGHVVSVSKNVSKVQTIIDTASNVSSTITTSRDSIVCSGMLKEKKLKAMYIPTDANLIIGDSIETSGMGGIYPKGIHIGNIEHIVNANNVTDRYAVISPAVDFEKVETVLVIKN